MFLFFLLRKSRTIKIAKKAIYKAFKLKDVKCLKHRQILCSKNSRKNMARVKKTTKKQQHKLENIIQVHNRVQTFS